VSAGDEEIAAKRLHVHWYVRHRLAGVH
jgi:hypothetical protein